MAQVEDIVLFVPNTPRECGLCPQYTKGQELLLELTVTVRTWTCLSSSFSVLTLTLQAYYLCGMSPAQDLHFMMGKSYMLTKELHTWRDLAQQVFRDFWPTRSISLETIRWNLEHLLCYLFPLWTLPWASQPFHSPVCPSRISTWSTVWVTSPRERHWG